MYLSQEIEFIFQGVGSTPIVEANQSALNQTLMQYWNNMIFISYVGTDGNRHRLIYHTVYKRWRNDIADAQSLLLEADTNTLVYGDSNGLVHIDRQDLAYDEESSAGTIVHRPIALDLMTPYNNQGMPDIQKNYNEVTIDANTAGATLTVTLWFDDGESSLVLGTFSSTERQKINFKVNAGDGYQGYKVALEITGSVTAQAYIYQCSIKALPLAKTRQSIDTYWIKLGGDDSKICKDIYFEYTSSSPVQFDVFYDGSSTPGFTFTLPSTSGVRVAQRVRLPAVAFRLIRFVGESSADFQVWEDSSLFYKFLCQGRGYSKSMLVPN
jgi:hypothetical protein